MKIKVINPNTTTSMTDAIEKAAAACAFPGTEIYAATPEWGPASIECFVDDYLAVPGVIQEIYQGEKDGMDAYVIACFGDPGLQAAKECTQKPVLGIAEAAIAAVKMAAPSFSVISVLERSKKITEDLILQYGAERACRSVRATGLSVLEFERDPEKGRRALHRESKCALERDGAESIVLGCAGFVDFAKELEKDLGIPVIDGVVPAVKFAEAFVGMGLNTSKQNSWGYPEKKELRGFELFRKRQGETK
ncbi:aspartate/glutamate racemase family protein [Ihubacter massiliensis]|uniref:Hydantoin racemase n=1 Tax=Hominibacterium faecale TaxID=2839743 RepID=A0A9J6QMU9_9FIRM|nr:MULTISPECIES: aspartate/glutamate racemase family protein [Eubacteriales Family XIII. Incertae Sedis]MCO7122998.1 aspartate/glutamate racemase family protein [Ihubacter massiliensis]MCU7377258.1 aspartate/glutamate racemase family protein [Hominibacterium faecale]